MPTKEATIALHVLTNYEIMKLLNESYAYLKVNGHLDTAKSVGALLLIEEAMNRLDGMNEPSN